MTNDISFGKALKHLRNCKGLSQRELSKALNIAPSTLAMYELNKREPDYKTLNKIADYFQVSTDYLLGRSNDPNPLDKITEESSNYNFEDLPDEAKKTLEDFINYIQTKYRRKEK